MQLGNLCGFIETFNLLWLGLQHPCFECDWSCDCFHTADEIFLEVFAFSQISVWCNFDILHVYYYLSLSFWTSAHWPYLMQLLCHIFMWYAHARSLTGIPQDDFMVCNVYCTWGFLFWSFSYFVYLLEILQKTSSFEVIKFSFIHFFTCVSKLVFLNLWFPVC